MNDDDFPRILVIGHDPGCAICGPAHKCDCASERRVLVGDLTFTANPAKGKPCSSESTRGSGESLA